MQIGLDISLTSTAAACRLSDGSVKHVAFTGKEDKNSWIKRLEGHAELVHATYRPVRSSTYSDSEISKLDHYMQLSADIARKLLATAAGEEVSSVRMEGFSHASTGQNKIDIIAFSTLLRAELRRTLPGASMLVIAPSQLKKHACVAAYGWTETVSKKTGLVTKREARDPNGLAGGSFTKTEMFKALVDSKLKCPLLDHALEWQEEILKLKQIPKPLDDLIDALWALEYTPSDH